MRCWHCRAAARRLQREVQHVDFLGEATARCESRSRYKALRLFVVSGAALNLRTPIAKRGGDNNNDSYPPESGRRKSGSNILGSCELHPVLRRQLLPNQGSGGETYRPN